MPELQLAPFYKSECFKVEADAALGVVRTEWLKASVTDQEIKTGGAMLCEAIGSTNAKKVLANAQTLGALSSKSKDWLATSYYENLSKLEIEKLARVLPPNLFGKLALESVITRAEAAGLIQFEVKNFSTDKEAMFWLLETV